MLPLGMQHDDRLCYNSDAALLPSIVLVTSSACEMQLPAMLWIKLIINIGYKFSSRLLLLLVLLY